METKYEIWQEITFEDNYWEEVTKIVHEINIISSDNIRYYWNDDDGIDFILEEDIL